MAWAVGKKSIGSQDFVTWVGFPSIPTLEALAVRCLCLDLGRAFSVRTHIRYVESPLIQLPWKLRFGGATQSVSVCYGIMTYHTRLVERDRPDTETLDFAQSSFQAVGQVASRQNEDPIDIWSNVKVLNDGAYRFLAG